MSVSFDVLFVLEIFVALAETNVLSPWVLVRTATPVELVRTCLGVSTGGTTVCSCPWPRCGDTLALFF